MRRERNCFPPSVQVSAPTAFMGQRYRLRMVWARGDWGGQARVERSLKIGEFYFSKGPSEYCFLLGNWLILSKFDGLCAGLLTSKTIDFHSLSHASLSPCKMNSSNIPTEIESLENPI